MRRFVVSLLLLAVSAWAADFWQSKKFTDWSEHDVRRMLDDSPWSKAVSVSGDLVAPAGTSRKSRDGGRGGMGEVGNPNLSAPDPMDDAPRSGVGRAAQNADPDRGAAPLLNFIVRWESALPVKEARLRLKYGSEAATSADARRVLETEEPNYVITVSGLSGNALRGDPGAVKKQVMDDAELMVKGKDPIKPVDFMVQRGNGVAIAVFAFPKSTPLTLEDKEVEFRARFDSIPVKQKFQLKNMMFAGKLEL
ncbi:MAG TPA: hypothetical protein VMB85_26275 [Bryobacteraceae bacterium]|nr:hypothetical protein [Bryobacteraceae bacterium]